MTLQLSCFVGPTLLSGIGQHCAKYVRLFPDAKYYLLNEEIPECDVAFLFLIPSGDFVEAGEVREESREEGHMHDSV